MNAASLPIDLTDPNWITALAASVAALALLFTAARLGSLARHVRKASEVTVAGEEFRKQHETLEAVRRYETDPQLRDSIRHIYNKTVHGTDYSLIDASDRFHVVTLLNYFDGIACGIEQGLLMEHLVKDYLQFVLDKNVRALLRGEDGPTWVSGQPVVGMEGFEVLLALHQRWNATSNDTLYEMLR